VNGQPLSPGTTAGGCCGSGAATLKAAFSDGEVSKSNMSSKSLALASLAVSSTAKASTQPIPYPGAQGGQTPGLSKASYGSRRSGRDPPWCQMCPRIPPVGFCAADSVLSTGRPVRQLVLTAGLPTAVVRRAFRRRTAGRGPGPSPISACPTARSRPWSSTPQHHHLARRNARPWRVQLPVAMFPVLFAIARTAGWMAQWAETRARRGAEDHAPEADLHRVRRAVVRAARSAPGRRGAGARVVRTALRTAGREPHRVAR
jgi:hypothetical protein